MQDKIIKIPIEQLVPYARNARTHSDEQVAQIAASIREFGFNNPVLIKADNTIIAGHGRVLAARKLNLSVVPCICLDHLTDTQARAYVIADNKLAMNAGWDENLLSSELDELMNLDISAELLGFEAEEFVESTDEEVVLSRPFEKIHVLVSIPVEDIDKIKHHLDLIEEVDEAEVVYGAN